MPAIDVDPQWIMMGVAAFAASVLQAATGIGFALVAGPFILVALNGTNAIQVTSLHSLLIAVLLAPGLWRLCDRAALAGLLKGTALGLPCGVALYALLDVTLLKLAAAATVVFALVQLARAQRRPDGASAREEPPTAFVPGILSGAMSGSLAMPGPAAAAHLARAGASKAATRATILVLFVFSYTAALGLQVAVDGIAAETLRVGALLAPATLVGIVVGRWLAGVLSERIFRLSLLCVLVVTVASLLISAVQDVI